MKHTHIINYYITLLIIHNTNVLLINKLLLILYFTCEIIINLTYLNEILVHYLLLQLAMFKITYIVNYDDYLVNQLIMFIKRLKTNILTYNNKKYKINIYTCAQCIEMLVNKVYELKNCVY